MSNYVLAFRADPNRTAPEGSDQAWYAWFGQLGAAITDHGNRTGDVTRLDPEGGAPSGGDVLTGYLVISADSMDAAVALAKGCPGLANGASVEVAEVVPA